MRYLLGKPAETVLLKFGRHHYFTRMKTLGKLYWERRARLHQMHGWTRTGRTRLKKIKVRLMRFERLADKRGESWVRKHDKQVLRLIAMLTDLERATLHHDIAPVYKFIYPKQAPLRAAA